LLPAQVAMLSR